MADGLREISIKLKVVYSC